MAYTNYYKRIEYLKSKDLYDRLVYRISNKKIILQIIGIREGKDHVFIEFNTKKNNLPKNKLGAKELGKIVYNWLFQNKCKYNIKTPLILDIGLSKFVKHGRANIIKEELKELIK